jgi:hypothetical protein
MKINQIRGFLCFNETLLIVHSLIWFSIFKYSELIWLFDFFTLGIFLLSNYYQKSKAKPIHLEELYPPERKKFVRISRGRSLIAMAFPFLPTTIQVLFFKELLSLWRNLKYRRLKGLTLIGFTIGLLILRFLEIEYAEMWMLVFTLIIIWLHYSNSFNDKYVLPDPVWYFKTVPIKFHKIWLAKFLSEFVFILVILLFFLLFILAEPLSMNQVLSLVLVAFFSRFYSPPVLLL